MSLSKCQPCLVEPQSLKLNLSRFSEWNSKPSDLDTNTRDQKSQNQENNFNSFSTSTNKKDIEKSGWSFFLALNHKSDITQKINSTQTENVYVHPLAKRSSSMLSQKSLEMCTENLGSETGCDMSMTQSYNNDIALQFQEKEELPTKLKSTENWAMKRLKRTISSFPPPLSSISNSSSLQMKPYREDGRLVLTAVTGCCSYFEAERSDGRLKLTLFDSTYSEVETKEELEEEEEEEEEEDGVVEITEGEENKREDKEVNTENEEDEIGIGKIKKLICRCKEGGCGNKNKMMMNWDQFWVAT